MTKPKNLKAKLKAADKRRKRRPQASAETALAQEAADGRPSVDAVGVLAEGVLRQADTRASSGGANLRDSAVLSALKAMTQGTQPRSEEAMGVFDEMNSLLEEAGVSGSRRTVAAMEMLSLATTNQDPNVPDQFIRYLSMITV